MRNGYSKKKIFIKYLKYLCETDLQIQILHLRSVFFTKDIWLGSEKRTI